MHQRFEVSETAGASKRGGTNDILLYSFENVPPSQPFGIYDDFNVDVNDNAENKRSDRRNQIWMREIRKTVRE